MTRKALTDHFARQVVEGGEQSRGAVPPTGADFGNAGGRARKSVGGIDRKSDSCGPWGPVGEGERLPAVVAGSTRD